ncbi:integrator complex subunit 9-like [Antedon mediterranea]|uniref:integrator complex subunit 9-like n=1 Tax=Antedon mediterranea TaxID=105859 RepID=UPI003AF70C92
MKLYCLSEKPNAPCIVVTFKGTTLMLDCSLDLQSLQHFIPLTLVPSTRLAKLSTWKCNGEKDQCNELKECGGRVLIDSCPEVCLPEFDMFNISNIDAILISNYHCMLALPFITEYAGFKGTIYATEPTVQFGKLYMDELVEFMGRVGKRIVASRWKQPDILKKLPAPLKSALNIPSWRNCYTQQDVNSALAKVKLVSFAEKTNLFGAVTVVPLSSGYCLGGCNWMIQSDFEKISYVAGSSFLTTHAAPINQQPMKDSDVMIITGVTQTPGHNPDTMLGEFCSNLAVTVKNGGNVLVPCYPSGVLFDLFECLWGYMDNMGLSQIPIYFISPVADCSLAYSQIFSEWLCSAKHSKVYLPEPPFPHADLIKNNRLKHYSSIHGEFSNQFKTPCVVFTGHPSLRFGDAVHFMEMWGKSSLNTVLFTEPDFPYLDALAPFQPLSMKACYCPIDPAMGFSQANKMIKDLKPGHLIIPAGYSRPPASLPHKTDLQIESDPSPVTFTRGEILNVPVKRKFEKIEISEQISDDLTPTEVRPGVLVSAVTGVLVVKDNQYVLQNVPPSNPPVDIQVSRKRRREEEVPKKPKHYIYGCINVDEFVQSLDKAGISDVKVEESPRGHIIHLQEEDTIIQLEESSTHIVSEGNEALRRKLRDILIKSLPSF